jgi:CRISPR system Cascade subunit CasB
MRAAFRARYCPYDDGRAAERVVRRLFLGEQPGPPPAGPHRHRTAPPRSLAVVPAPPAGETAGSRR